MMFGIQIYGPIKNGEKHSDQLNRSYFFKTKIVGRPLTVKLTCRVISFRFCEQPQHRNPEILNSLHSMDVAHCFSILYYFWFL